MERASSYIGVDIYCGGKVIGRITDFIIDARKKSVSSIKCISNTGIIRLEFTVPKSGILHIDRNGVVVDKNKISYKKNNEEYSQDTLGIYNDTRLFSGSPGDVYFEPGTFKLSAVSIKKGLIDDVLFGREIVDINDISLTNKGQIIKKG